MSDIGQLRRKWTNQLVAGLVIGFGALMLGMTATAWGMARAFQSLEAQAAVAPGDPANVSMVVGEVLILTALGIAVAIPSFVVAIVAKIRLAKLRRAQSPASGHSGST